MSENLSNKCPKCGSGSIVQLLVYRSDGNTKYYCQECGHAWLFPVERQTVFNHITQSPEVLAPNLVFWEGGWTSRFIQFTSTNKEEAIAATVAKLKEVAK